MAFYYQVYGLKLKSELELPELASSTDTSVDISIAVRRLPSSLPRSRSYGSWAEYTEDRCLLRIANVGRFLIEGGRSITVDRLDPAETDNGAAAPMSDVRLYLLGSALAALLHQRGLLPLHVSAVLADSGVWAFTGDSGAGKSTVAGWLSQSAGLPLISDDVSVAGVRNGPVHLYSGPRKLKLWDDAVEFLNLEKSRLVQDLTNTPKFQIYLPDDLPDHPFQLAGLVMLERAEQGEHAELIPVTGIDRFRCCCKAVYRPYMARWFRSKAAYVRDVFQLAESIQVLRLRRPWSLEQMEEEMNPLRELLSTNSKKAASQ